MHGLPTFAAYDTGADLAADRILRNSLEVQTLSANLQKQLAKPVMNRERRLFAYDFANGSFTLGGLITAMTIFYRHSHDKEINGKRVHNHAPSSQLGFSLYPQILGQVIGGTGSYYELYRDFKQEREIQKLSFSPKIIRRRIKHLTDDTEKEFGFYSSETLSLSALEHNQRMSELRVLKDIWEISLKEYSNIDALHRGERNSNIAQDLISGGRNTVGAVGNSLNVAGVFRNNKHLNGAGSLLNMVSAASITARPLVFNSFMFSAQSRMQNLEPLYEQFNVDTGKLGSDTGSEVAGERLALYKLQARKYSIARRLEAQERNRRKVVALRSLRESIYGPEKLTQSVLGTVVDFRTESNATADNRLNAAGNTTYVAGQTFNLTELLRERIVDEKTWRRQREQGLLPSQQIEQETKILSEMQGVMASHKILDEVKKDTNSP